MQHFVFWTGVIGGISLAAALIRLALDWLSDPVRARWIARGPPPQSGRQVIVGGGDPKLEVHTASHDVLELPAQGARPGRPSPKRQTKANGSPTPVMTSRVQKAKRCSQGKRRPSRS